MNSPTERRGYEGLREVLGMATPIILGTLSFTVMHFVDQVMVAQLGESALAAISSSGVWAFTLSAFFLGVIGCVATFAAQSLGRGRQEDCARYAWQGVYLSLGTGVGAVALWPMSDALFAIMNHSPEVTRLETLYFKIRLLGYVFISWQAALSAFFQAVSRPRIPMYVAVVVNIINIALDYVLIFGKFGFPAWGIGGAAAATVISLAVQVLLLHGVFLAGRFNAEFQTRATWRVDWTKIRELLRIGWPGGLTFMMDVLNWAVFTSFVIGYLGNTVQLAAHGVAMNFLHVCFMPVVGLSHAVTPIVGQWIGRADIATAKARTYTALRLAMPYMITMGLVFAFFGPSLTRFFFSADPDVVRLGHILLILAAVFQGFDAVNIIMIGALRGAGDTKWMMWAFFIAGYIFFLPIAFALSAAAENAAVGAWVGATLYIIGLSALLFWRFHSEGWRHIQIFESDRLAA